MKKPSRIRCLDAAVVKVGTRAPRAAVAVGAVVGMTLMTASCSSDGGAKGQAEARQLVSAAQAAGVAPGLTVQTAEALYGSSAPQVCDVLADGISSAEAMLLTGNPAGRRPKLVTADAVTYGRLVVQTYCPDHLATYDDLVTGIDGPTRTG